MFPIVEGWLYLPLENRQSFPALPSPSSSLSLSAIRPFRKRAYDLDFALDNYLTETGFFVIFYRSNIRLLERVIKVRVCFTTRGKSPTLLIISPPLFLSTLSLSISISSTGALDNLESELITYNGIPLDLEPAIRSVLTKVLRTGLA